MAFAVAADLASGPLLLGHAAWAGAHDKPEKATRGGMHARATSYWGPSL